MSNPVVTVSNSIPAPEGATTVRTTYMLKDFSSVKFFSYKTNQNAKGLDPSNMGPEFYIFRQLIDVVEGDKPDFVTEEAWKGQSIGIEGDSAGGIGTTPSGFITANKSFMPKIIGPSTLLVDNGVKTANGRFAAKWYDKSTESSGGSGQGTAKDLFNWEFVLKGNKTPTDEDAVEYMGISRSPRDSQYLFTKSSGEASVIRLSNFQGPTGNFDSTTLVGGGAFTLLASLCPITAAEHLGWSFEVAFGDVLMSIGEASTMTVKIAGEDNQYAVNLSDAMSKEGPPQAGLMDGAPLIIGVYPCWNGIVVTTGRQETKEVVKVSSTLCRKIKSASLKDPRYTGNEKWFDPTNPKNVEVSTGSGATNTNVNFGNKIEIRYKNTYAEIAYLPNFFAKTAEMDGWLLLAEDSNEISYSYGVYTVFTRNGTSYDVGLPKVYATDHTGGVGTKFSFIPWTMENPVYSRFAGEIFAYILQTNETRTYSIKNGNGNFELTWTGGTPGDNSAHSWDKYITNLNVSIGLDGSNGSVTVDKYGLAGQDAVVNQSVGAIVLDVEGGVGTIGGNIFQGIGMGIGSVDSVAEATWTIPLVGLEKKLEDIALINPPFVDGFTLSAALDYLCGYAGIQYEIHGDGGVSLPVTENIMAAVFDWKSGTSVKSALDEIIADRNYSYCIFDGKLQVYELDDYGFPVELGPDRSIGYESVNIVTRDNTPDFEDLRNYVVGVGMQEITQGTETDQETPIFPLIDTRTKRTTPDIPWAKCLVRPFSGMLTEETLSNMVDKLDKISSKYRLVGKCQIPGNASIRPYDCWGSDYIIYSVAHNVDLVNKTWTTDLEFQRRGVE